jgi:hypothetical protein
MRVTDPTSLYRLRDGVYALDLLIVAIADLDLFTRLAAGQRPRRAAVAGTSLSWMHVRRT